MGASGHSLFRGCCLTLILGLLIAFVVSGVSGFAPPAEAAISSSVAYVTDFGTGSNDTSGPGSGSSIFVNALTGSAPSGSYTTADTTLTVTVTDVSVSSIDSGGVAVLTPFNTVILYQICDIGSHPATVAAINAYLTAGSGKVLIFDADRCSGFDGFPAAANYSAFLFPFTASTPGPQGASGSYTTVVPSSLTTGLSAGVQPGDSVGDANNFVTFDSHWCGSITATNTLGNTNFVEAYARTPADGLVVYEGEDFWFTFGPTTHLRTVFDLMLEEPFNPDTLPAGTICPLPASGISLAPATQSACTGAPATVTARVVDVNGNGQGGVTVNFVVTGGPNTGVAGSAVTDSSGNASFTYSSAVFGTDVLHASFVDTLGNTHVSNDVNVLWNSPPQAICKNVTAPADATCHASASVNNGSFDPDGDAVSVSQAPPGPYSLGATGVTLTASDGICAPSTCSATVTVVDNTPPTVTCVKSVNPSGQNIPTAGANPKSGQGPAGFYLVSASDNCSAFSPLTITIGGIPLANGETIKITQSPGKSGVTLVDTMGPLAIKHFDVGPGDAVITATDGSGNTATVTCLVPPPPK